MKLKPKSLLIIIGGTLGCIIFFALVSLNAFRSYSTTDLHSQGKMAAELLRLTITHEMEEGNPEHISPYLLDISDVPGLINAHVIPAESVIKQYNLDPNRLEKMTATDRKVFETGKPIEEFIDDERFIFHYTIPYIASQKSKTNCLSCHHAEEGEVIGAVSIKMDITDQREAAFESVATISAVLLFFGIIWAFAITHIISPVIDTAAELKNAVSKGKAGDFSARIQKRSNDEIGEIAEQTNQFMETLEGSFGEISKKIEGFTGVCKNEDRNLLEHTTGVVDDLVSATQFKQYIENDRDLDEVFNRISRVLKQRFGLKRFSIYENNDKDTQLRLISSEGLPEGADYWCDREITIDCNACRAKRTALTTGSIADDEICPKFAGNIVQSDNHLYHLCFPMMLSGSVGGVLQILFTQEEVADVQRNETTLHTYLSEATPVIESKRLMLSLKETSMRDPMTNLYNRRFLEEYLPTLLATAERQQSSIAILMCDVDFFKQVNDTLGHEAGDTVLIKVSEILRQSIRASDLAVRFGGEEFLAILIGSNEEKSLEVAERIRTTMAEHTFKTASGNLQKTISVGISLFPVDGDAFWECVKFADVAMYEAKETGRNKVLRFTKAMWKDGENY